MLKMNSVIEASRCERFLYLAAASFFLFFLAYSSPHLVHHSFDESQSTPCLALSTAKDCPVQPIPAVNFSIAQIISKRVVLSLEVWISHPLPLASSIRAPPIA